MKDMRVAGQEGFRTGGCSTGGMQCTCRRDAMQEGCKTRHEVCSTGGIQDRNDWGDAGQDEGGVFALLLPLVHPLEKQSFQ